jgi:uncharacterized membrane protein
MLVKSRAVRNIVLFLLIMLLLTGISQAVEPSFSDDASTIILRGRVLSVEDIEPDESVQSFIELEQLASIEIIRGQYKGEVFTLVNSLMGHPLFDLYLTEGRQVVLWGEVDDDGVLRDIYLQDFARDKYLYLIVGLFILTLLAVGRRKGLTTVVTLTITILAIFRILLPLILAGYSPIGATIVVATAVSLITILALNGLHRKTFAAVIGTVGGVMVAGLLALFIGNAANLTGFSSEEAQMLMFMEGGPIDVRGLLFAGIIIGSLGAVMDVTVTISSSVYEVYCADRTKCLRELISSAMNVGRDIMGTMANTLILAYVGTAAPLLLLFMGYSMPWPLIINSDLVATEVVRALAGSIGLIAAIPLTAVTSGLLLARGERALPTQDIDQN